MTADDRLARLQVDVDRLARFVTDLSFAARAYNQAMAELVAEVPTMVDQITGVLTRVREARHAGADLGLGLAQVAERLRAIQEALSQEDDDG